MGTGHQGEAVGVVEGFRDVLSKGVTGTSGGDAPPTAIVRVRPQQVTHRALRQKHFSFRASSTPPSEVPQIPQKVPGQTVARL